MPYQDFLDFLDSPLHKAHEERQYRHETFECFGDSCFSCGCWKPAGRVCISHEGSAKFQVYTMQKLTEALNANLQTNSSSR